MERESEDSLTDLAEEEGRRERKEKDVLLPNRLTRRETLLSVLSVYVLACAPLIPDDDDDDPFWLALCLVHLFAAEGVTLSLSLSLLSLPLFHSLFLSLPVTE